MNSAYNNNNNNNYYNNNNNFGDIFSPDYIDGPLTSKRMIIARPLTTDPFSIPGQMYHFVSEQTPELRLSDTVLISGRTTQYMKCFQLDAVRYLHDRLSKQEFCIFNDESGLGKCATIAALLNGLGGSKKTLIVLQNDDHLLAGWQFHLAILTDLPVCVLKDVNDSTTSAHSVYLSKWSVLRSIGDLSKLQFDLIIVDHRGYTLNNNFCTSMLLKQYERKVNIVISSVDITSDVKLLYNVLRLGGCLEHQYKTYLNFERKFHLPDVKEVLSKRVDLEEYYKQRGVLGEYIKDFRLRRYCHQFESYLPLVTTEQYKLNLSLWLSENNSNSTISQTTIESSTEVLSTGGTDEIFECLMSIKHEREWAEQREDPEQMSVSEDSDEVIGMEPLIFHLSESENEETVDELLDETTEVTNNDVVLLSSDDCEIVTPPTTPTPTTSPKTKSKRKFAKRTQSAKVVEITESETDAETEATMPMPAKSRKLNVILTRIKVPQTIAEQVTKEPKSPKQQATNTTKTLNKKSAKETEKVQEEVSTNSRRSAAAASKQSEKPTISAAEASQKVSEEAASSSRKSAQRTATVASKKVEEQPTSSAKPAELTAATQATKSPSILLRKKTQEQKTPVKTKDETVVAKKMLRSTTEQKTPPKTRQSPTAQKPQEEKTQTKTTPRSPQEQRTPLAPKAAAVTPVQKTPRSPKIVAVTPELKALRSPKTAAVTPEQKTPRSPKAAEVTPEQKTSRSLKATAATFEEKKKSPLSAKQEKLVTPKSEPRPKRLTLRDMNSDEVVVRQTRGMQRLTRSADSRTSKYMAPLKCMEFDKRGSPRVKRRIDVKQEEVDTPKKSKAIAAEAAPTASRRGRGRGRGRGRSARQEQESTPSVVASKKKTQVTVSPAIPTPDLLSSGSSNTDYSYMQCAQKLPDNLTELESFSDFRIPQAPRMPSPLMLPSTLNFFSDSEVQLVPSSSAKVDLVVINSSNDECSQQSTTQSRRTRALKRKVASKDAPSEPSTSSFGQLLAQQRRDVNKSPDIFSNCSDLSQITLAQAVPPTASSFEGFKIFGSEVKQQQQEQQPQPTTLAKKHRERSCLDILENIFDADKPKGGQESGISLLPTLLSPQKQLAQRRFTMLDDDIFDITNNGEFGSRLRLNSSGDVSPVHQQQHQQQKQPQLPTQRNKITKYLIGSGCTPDTEDMLPQRSTQSSTAQRKSPKSIKSTQSTKLTRWFNSSSGSQSAPSTPVVPVEKAIAARMARSGGATKRKQLNLFK